MRLRDRRPFLPQLLVVFPVLQNHWSVGDVDLRPVELGHLPLDLVRHQVIVGVEILHPFAVGQFEQPVPRDVPAAVRTRFDTNCLAERTNDRQAAVRRTVVDNHNLFVRPGLVEG